MLARPTRDATPPPLLTAAELRQQMAATQALLLQAEAKEQAQAEERAHYQGNKVLAPASPSPRKKRTSVVLDPSILVRPKAPRLSPAYDSTQAGPPPPILRDYNPKGPSHSHDKPDSYFHDNDAAPRKSAFETGMRSMTREIRHKDDRKDLIANRSTAFDLSKPKSLRPLPSATSAPPPAKPASKPKPSAAAREMHRRNGSPPRKPAPLGDGMTRHIARPAAPPPPPRPTSRARSPSPKDEDDESEDGLDVVGAPEKTRHADGTVIEHLELGPWDHSAKMGFPLFPRLEPYSGIHLLTGSRRVPQSVVDEHMGRRYPMSTSQIYAIGRPPTGSLNGEVGIEVEYDFVLIAVLAEKDETRFVRADALRPDGKEEKKPNRWQDPLAKKKADAEDVPGEEKDEAFRQPTKKIKRRRYLNFTLVDLSTEAAAAAGTGTLKLTMFEAEREEVGEDDDGNEVRTFVGGSGGAYEKFWKEEVGGVVAILNPTVRQYRSNSGEKVWSVSPTSAEGMMVLGQARDLGRCKAIQWTTKEQCKSWCDKRVNELCHYHVQSAVKTSKNQRPEMYNTSASINQTGTYDPAKFKKQLRTKSAAPNYATKTGLLPDPLKPRPKMVEGATTYVNKGRKVIPPLGGLTRGGMGAAALASGNGSGGYIPGLREGPTVTSAREQLVKERREREERRRWEEEVVKHDKGKTVGGEYVEAAMRARREKEKGKKAGKVAEGEKGKGKGRARAREAEGESGEEGEGADEAQRKRPFSSAAVRLIGYDPTGKTNEDADTKRTRLAAISSLSAAELDKRPRPKLSAPPGERVRSGVVAPASERREVSLDSDDDDDGLVIEGAPHR